MRSLFGGFLALSLLLATPRPGLAAGVQGQGNGLDNGPGGPGCRDSEAVAAVRDTCDKRCCANTKDHGQYMGCVDKCANAMAKLGVLPHECKGAVMKCTAQSTCGRPGMASCCRTDAHGRTKCSIKKIGKCKAPKGGSACMDMHKSCCDACKGNGSPCSPNGAFLTGSQPALF